MLTNLGHKIYGIAKANNLGKYYDIHSGDLYIMYSDYENNYAAVYKFIEDAKSLNCDYDILVSIGEEFYTLEELAGLSRLYFTDAVVTVYDVKAI